MNMMTFLSRRLSTTAAAGIKKTPPPVVPSSPTTVIKKGGSSILQRLTAFIVGVSVGGGCGYYQMKLDLDASTEQIQDALAALKLDVSEYQGKQALPLAPMKVVCHQSYHY